MGERGHTRISCLARVHSDRLGSMGGRPTVQRRTRLATPVDLVVLASDIKRCSGTLTIERVRRLAYHGVEDGRGNATYASGSLGNTASIGGVDTIDFVSLSMTTSVSLYYSFCASSDDLRSPRKRFFLNCDPRPRQKYNPPRSAILQNRVQTRSSFGVTSTTAHQLRISSLAHRDSKATTS